LEVQHTPALNRANTLSAAWSFAAGGLLALFYFWSSVHIAAGRFIWYDEVRTVRVARLPDYATIWAALTHSIEVLPPPYYMIVRLFDKLWPDPFVAVRLPSALGLFAGLILVFDCARRLTTGLHGLIAAALLTCSFLPFYGYEARPYALCFMMAALSLWVWTQTNDKKTSSAVVFGVTIFLGIMVHYCAVLTLVPYVVWEIVNWRPWQRPSPRIIAGVFGVVAATALLFRQIEALGALSPKPPLKPSFFELRTFFSDLFPNGPFLLALILVWIALVSRKQETVSLPAMQAGERLGWLFLTIPLVCFAVPMLGTNSLQTRYFICVLPGIAVAFSCWLRRQFPGSWLIPGGVLLLLAGWGTAERIQVMRHRTPLDASQSQGRIQNFLALEAAARKDGKQYIVFDRITWFLEASQNSSRSAQYMFLDPSAFHKAVTNVMNKNLARYSPMPTWNYQDLQKHAREAALIGPEPARIDALEKAGFQLQIRFTDPPYSMYYFE
jgi:hypothetical protein